MEDIFPDKEVHGLHVLYGPAEPSVDIISVYGLIGNSSDTWRDAKLRVYWPTQLLSRDIPDARIMSFGYGPDPTVSLSLAGQKNIRRHASNLIGGLAVRPCDIYFGIDSKLLALE